MSTRPPRLTMEQSEAIERGDCHQCGKPAAASAGGRNGCTAAYEDGRWVFRAECVECWNASVAQARAERKAELAARPGCEACGKRKQRYDLKPNGRVSVGLCGPCAKRAQLAFRQPMLFATGWGNVTREGIIEAARRDPRAA
jgi:hypothetical protein